MGCGLLSFGRPCLRRPRSSRSAGRDICQIWDRHSAASLGRLVLPNEASYSISVTFDEGSPQSKSPYLVSVCVSPARSCWPRGPFPGCCLLEDRGILAEFELYVKSKFASNQLTRITHTMPRPQRDTLWPKQYAAREREKQSGDTRTRTHNTCKKCHARRSRRGITT